MLSGSPTASAARSAAVQADAVLLTRCSPLKRTSSGREAAAVTSPACVSPAKLTNASSTASVSYQAPYQSQPSAAALPDVDLLTRVLQRQLQLSTGSPIRRGSRLAQTLRQEGPRDAYAVAPADVEALGDTPQSAFHTPASHVDGNEEELSGASALQPSPSTSDSSPALVFTRTTARNPKAARRALALASDSDEEQGPADHAPPTSLHSNGSAAAGSPAPSHDPLLPGLPAPSAVWGTAWDAAQGASQAQQGLGGGVDVSPEQGDSGHVMTASDHVMAAPFSNTPRGQSRDLTGPYESPPVQTLRRNTAAPKSARRAVVFSDADTDSPAATPVRSAFRASPSQPTHTLSPLRTATTTYQPQPSTALATPGAIGRPLSVQPAVVVGGVSIAPAAGVAGAGVTQVPASPAPWSCFKPLGPRRRRSNPRSPRYAAPASPRAHSPAALSDAPAASSDTNSSAAATTDHDTDSESNQGTQSEGYHSGTDSASDREYVPSFKGVGAQRRPVVEISDSQSGSESEGAGGEVESLADRLGRVAIEGGRGVTAPQIRPSQPQSPPQPELKKPTTQPRVSAPTLQPPAAMSAAPRRQRVSAAQKEFQQRREAIAQQLYKDWNRDVFGGRLPPELPVVWNPRLVSTAGQVLDDGSQDYKKTSNDQRVPCRLELSSKVLTTLARLRNTLAHEMCHVAAWHIDSEYAQPHGPSFRHWADVFMAHDERAWAQRRAAGVGSQWQLQGASADGHSGAALAGAAAARGAKGTLATTKAGSKHVLDTLPATDRGTSVSPGRTAGLSSTAWLDAGDDEELGPVVITRLHNFETHMPFRWQCQNTECNKVFQRHRNSIQPGRHVCNRCRGQLRFLGKFSKTNKLLAGPGVPTSNGNAGASLATPGPPNAYREFVKTHYSALKAAHPPGTPMPTIMKEVAARWAKHKESQKTDAPPTTTHAPLPAHTGPTAAPAVAPVDTAAARQPVAGAARVAFRTPVLLPGSARGGVWGSPGGMRGAATEVKPRRLIQVLDESDHDESIDLTNSP